MQGPRREPNNAPAGIPLCGCVAGLALAGSIHSPLGAAAGLAVCAALALRRWRRIALFLLFAAVGLAVGTREHSLRESERAAVASMSADRFAVVEAPLEGEWTRRGSSFQIRAEHFRAGGTEVGAPLAVYARFAPPPVAMQTRLRAEGFLRISERETYTLTVKSPRLLSYEGTLSPFAPAAWNRALLRRLDRLTTTHPDAVGLASALALGRSERLTEPLRESFRRAGTYHLIVFSGLQIAVAAGAIAWLLRLLGRPRASDWLLLAFSLIAPLFIGATASVSRASIGIGVYALTRILRRPTSIENLWCVSAFLRLLLAPSDLTDVSFQLTYAGAGALLFVAGAFPRHRWIAGAAGAELAITPLTLLHFHQYALGGSILTLVLTPVIFAMLIASAALLAVPGDATVALLEMLHRVCIAINATGAPVAGFHAAPPLAAIAVGFGVSLLAVALLGGRTRACAIALALSVPLLAAVAAGGRSDAPSLTLFDVGQGDAILVRSGESTLLVDGGGEFESSRFGEAVLLPLLVDRGIRRIDIVALSHAHPDHCGGLPAVVRHLEVGEIWISPRRFSGPCATELLEAARERATPLRLLRDGARIATPGMFITVLTAGHRFKRAPENNGSAVLRLQIERNRILLTGDIEREAERVLAGRFGRADVLKVAHHGSRSSTTDAFLDEVQPRLALISCGRHNLFGHPHDAVVETLRRRGIALRRTDRNGSIDVPLGNGRGRRGS